MAKKKNVLFILVDSLRSDALGVMGNPICKTPNIDKLAADGTAFRLCFSQHPACAPSRASILTGWYPHIRGHRTFTYHIQKDEENLLKYFKRDGYCVKAIGTNDCLHEDCFEESMDEWVECNRLSMDGMEGPLSKDSEKKYAFLTGRLDTPEAKEDRNWEIKERALDFIKQKQEKPWFLYLAFYIPHPKYGVPDPWYSMYKPEDMPEPIQCKLDDKTPYMQAWREATRMDKLDAKTIKQIRSIYYGMVSLTDHYVGALVDELRKNKQYDDTTIVFLSDHGDFTGDYGLVEKGEACVQDAITNVPLIIKPPSELNCTPRKIDQQLCESIDVLPTLLEINQIPLRHNQYGRSLLPLMQNKAREHKDAVFTVGGYNPDDHFATLGMQRRKSPMLKDPNSVYSAKLKMEIERPELSDRYVCMRTTEWKYVHRGSGPCELYDLKNDPRETINLVVRGGHETTIAKLKDRLLEFYLRVSDSVSHKIDDRLCAAAWDPKQGLRKNTIK